MHNSHIKSATPPPLSTSPAPIPLSADPATDSTLHFPIGDSTFSNTQWRFCLSTIKNLKKQKDAGPFNQPVDPVALKIPHYPTIVKNPMDFSTIERKLASSNPAKPDPNLTNPRYYSADEFIGDVRLVFSNTLKFNGPDHAVTAMGKRLEEVFDKQVKNIPAAEVVGILLICYLFMSMSSHLEATETSSCQESHDTSCASSPTKESGASQTIHFRSSHQTIRSGADWPSEKRNSSTSTQGPAIRRCSQKEPQGQES
jgi:hypothetical protein